MKIEYNADININGVRTTGERCLKGPQCNSYVVELYAIVGAKKKKWRHSWLECDVLIVFQTFKFAEHVLWR